MHNPPHAGRILNNLYLKPLGLSVTQAAESLCITRTALSEIIHGKRAITPKTALKLAKAFGTTPDLWMNLQQRHDLWQQSQQYQPDDVKVLYEHCA